MEAKWLAALLLALLVLPSGQAWSQVGGGPSRDEPAILPGGALDVLASAPIGASPGAFWTPGMLPTRDGAVAYLRGERGGCELAFFESVMAADHVGHDASECDSPNLAAYDARTNAAILCHVTSVSGAVLEARDATTGARLWRLVPAQAFSLAADERFAYCFSVALDETTREVIAPVMGCCTTRPARLVSIDVDTGNVNWVQEVPTGPSQLGPDARVPQPGSFTAFESYHGVALTTTGIILSGYYDCGTSVLGVGVYCEEGVLAWADRDGVVRGKERAVTSEPQEMGRASYERTRGASQYAIGRGPLAAAAVGDEILLINPELPEPVARRLIEATSPNTFTTFIPKGHWHEDRIIAALGTSFTAFSASTLEQQWSWSEGLDHSVIDSVRAQTGDILALLQRNSDASIHLATIDTQTGRTRSLLAVPITIPDEQLYTYDAHLVPLGAAGLLVVGENGERVLLGRAPEEELPRLTLEPEYPEPGEEVLVKIDAATDDVKHLLVTWEGAGVVQVAANETPRHIFAQRGEREVRVTAVLADGRTRTATATVHVGGSPPPQLTALQKAFSPENQEITFFILGAMITIVGVVVTVTRHRRRFAKLERELAAVEEIRMLSVEDPRSAVLALKSYRDRLPQDLARRRIDDSQYQILDIRSARLLKVLRTRMFAPFDARLSMRYHRLLDAAFEDAILQPSERLALAAALDAEEALRPEDRGAIAAILDDFTTSRVDLH